MEKERLIVLFCFVFLACFLLFSGCSSQDNAPTTTTASTSSTTSITSTSTTTTSVTSTTQVPGAIIRLYYTFSPSGSKGDARAFGCAYSTNGVNFTVESSALLTANYLTDPDVFKELSGVWVMLYSKATSPINSTALYKATCASATGSFATDTNFIGDLGNICSTLRVGAAYYTYTVSAEGIVVCTYEAGANRLYYIRAVTNSEYVDPSVIQFSANRFIMYVKNLNRATCTAESTNAINNWAVPVTLFPSAEVPGALYINNNVYLYYVDFAQTISGGGHPIVVRTSSDGGSTYSSAEMVTGLPESACDPDPVAYE